jgi:hypothetical protein
MISGLLLPSMVRLELRIAACADPGASGTGRSCTARSSGLPVASSFERLRNLLAPEDARRAVPGGAFRISDALGIILRTSS